MSPRKLSPDTTFEDLESEVMYTVAALEADPDAAPLVAETQDWLGWVDEGRRLDRIFRQHEAKVDARRVVASGRLDVSCLAYGKRLLAACNLDRTSLRFVRFFARPPSVFVKQALDKQIAGVMGWLTVTDEAELEPFRAELQARASAARAGLDDTAALGPRRGENLARREKLADDLTRERDALHRQLGDIAADKGLGRDWASLFFKQAHRKDDDASEPTPPPA